VLAFEWRMLSGRLIRFFGFRQAFQAFTASKNDLAVRCQAIEGVGEAFGGSRERIRTHAGEDFEASSCRIRELGICADPSALELIPPDFCAAVGERTQAVDQRFEHSTVFAMDRQGISRTAAFLNLYERENVSGRN